MLPETYKNALQDALSTACAAVAGAPVTTVWQKPRDDAHGDYATPVAMQLARQLKRPPLDIARDILKTVQLPDFVESAAIAGAGYINIRLKKNVKTTIISDIWRLGMAYGRGTDKKNTIILEFVSANPTGPLHVGHGRAAAFGDSLANILIFSGYHVYREYYLNNAGRQAAILAASVWLRYWLHCKNDDVTMPEGSYRGDYLQTIVAEATVHLTSHTKLDLSALLKSLATDADTAADQLVAAMFESFSSKVAADAFVDAMLQAVITQHIRKDLAALGVAPFDRWFSEKSLYVNGKISAGIDALRHHNANNVYEQDGALWFRATAFGDDKDRVLRRTNGQFTYFAADIAYHYDKLTRAVPADHRLRLINVLGADHHGYVPRLCAAVTALGGGAAVMETCLIQFVALVENGKRLKMSTRAGEFVSLAGLIEKVGRDAARYFYVSRKNDQHLDFDLQLAVEKNGSNPVYYAQYAHARTHGILRKWGGDTATLVNADHAQLADDDAALMLCDRLIAFPDAVARAAAERATHLLTTYVQELAVAMHNYYEKTRILTDTEDEIMRARLSLLVAARQVLASAFSLLGVSAPVQM